jgi:streptogramin lyase
LSYSCFNASHHFQHAAEGPIAVSTILTLDPVTGAVVSDWGSNLFYMPHGIATDAEDNIWVTDVALHQVLKVGKPDNSVTIYCRTSIIRASMNRASKKK